MSNKYKNGKIYKIVDNTNDNVYIGSTIQTLSERISKHKHRKTCSSREILKNGDYDIILIEDYPCNSKQELELRERYYIENTDCINKNIPGRSGAEWYQDNKEIILEYQKQYLIENKQKIKDYKDEYRKNNKDKIKQANKQYREENKEKLKKKKQKYIENNKDKYLKYQKYMREYRKSWGGDERTNNSLLKIDTNLFL